MSKTHLSHLLPYVENLPVSKEEFVQAIKSAIEQTRENGSVVLSWAGAYDVIVFANGTFSLIDTMHSKQYELSEDPEFYQERTENVSFMEEPKPKVAIKYAIANVVGADTETPTWGMTHGPFNTISEIKGIIPDREDGPYFIVELHPERNPRPFMRWKEDAWILVPDAKRDVLQKSVKQA